MVSYDGYNGYNGYNGFSLLLNIILRVVTSAVSMELQLLKLGAAELI